MKNKLTSSQNKRAIGQRNHHHILFSELVAALAILLLVSAAIAQPDSSNTPNQSLILEDLQLQPRFISQQSEPLQWLTVIEVSCRNCVEGENATFLMTITNLATRPFILNAIILADTDQIVFGGKEINSQLSPNQTTTFAVPVTLPPATRGHTLFYLPCFSITDSLAGEPQQFCERAPRRLMLSGFSIESMVASIYILIAIVLLAVAVAYFALSRRFDAFEIEEVSEAPSKQSS